MTVSAVNNATPASPATPTPQDNEQFEQAIQDAIAQGGVTLLGQNAMRMLMESLNEAQPED